MGKVSRASSAPCGISAAHSVPDSTLHNLIICAHHTNTHDKQTEKKKARSLLSVSYTVLQDLYVLLKYALSARQTENAEQSWLKDYDCHEEQDVP